MQIIEVEAVEDRSRAEGGHALILLRGIEGQPPTGNFKLTLADLEATLPEGRSLSESVFTPLSVMQTGDGLALAVGPEVTEHPALVPGTAYTLEVIELGMSGVVLWPAIAPIARPKRRNIMTRRIAGDPLPARVGSIRPVQQPIVATATTQHEQREQIIDTPSPRRVVARVAPAPRPSALQSGQIDEAAEATFASPAPMARMDALDNSVGDEIATAPDMSAIVATAISAVRFTDEPLAFESTSPPQSHIETGASDLSESRQDVQSQPTQLTSEMASAKPAPVSVTNVIEAASSAAPAAIGKQAPIPAPHASHTPAASHASGKPVRRLSTIGAVAMTAALLIAGQLAAMTAFDLNLSPRQRALVSAAPIAPVPSDEPAEETAAAPTRPARNIYDVIVAGPRSPRGVPGDGVPAAKAIQTAHAMLHGPAAQRDPEEAIYWLKRYLSIATGAESARVALTQLGSAYVEPRRGDQDYTSARLAWELASALGDSVSMCFLGAMHEHGLGIPISQANASVWYERAAAAGRSCVTSTAASPAK